MTSTDPNQVQGTEGRGLDSSGKLRFDERDTDQLEAVVEAEFVYVLNKSPNGLYSEKTLINNQRVTRAELYDHLSNDGIEGLFKRTVQALVSERVAEKVPRSLTLTYQRLRK